MDGQTDGWTYGGTDGLPDGWTETIVDYVKAIQTIVCASHKCLVSRMC